MPTKFKVCLRSGGVHGFVSPWEYRRLLSYFRGNWQSAEVPTEDGVVLLNYEHVAMVHVIASEESSE